MLANLAFFPFSIQAWDISKQIKVKSLKSGYDEQYNDASSSETNKNEQDNDDELDSAGLPTDEINFLTILNETYSNLQNQLGLKKPIDLAATPMPEPQQQTTINSSVTLRNLNDSMVKVYKCCYCDFICNTASRFHVHFVQHLNTKPFMCSVCEHVSFVFNFLKQPVS